MRHEPGTVLYAIGWFEGQIDAWKAEAYDNSAKKTLAEVEAVFKTISEGVDDLVKELADAQRRLASVRSLTRTSAEEHIEAIRSVLSSNTYSNV